VFGDVPIQAAVVGRVALRNINTRDPKCRLWDLGRFGFRLRYGEVSRNEHELVIGTLCGCQMG
jgi:hypothetical protein